MRSRTIIVLLSVLLLGACASARQEVTRIEGGSPKQVCIVKHEAVRPEFLDALQEGFDKNGIRYRVIGGSYELRNQMWYPRWKTAEVGTCDALGFYVANWNWDLANYMSFANIWLTTPDGKKKIGQGLYDATKVMGSSKFINARSKVLELVDQMAVR